MRAMSPKPDLQKQHSTSDSKSAAHVSLRAVTGLEVASVIVSVLVTVWVIIPMQIERRWLIAVPGILGLALMINSHRARGETFRELGFTSAHFQRAVRMLIAPTLLACGIFGVIGFGANSFHRNTHFWSTLLFLPVWGTFQQYILQGFIYRRMRSLIVDEDAPPKTRKRQINRAIIATALIFAFVHLPNPTLTLLTLVGGVVWTRVYERAPNLIALGLSHALMSLMLITSLPPWLLQSMSVGYKHFLYQKF